MSAIPDWLGDVIAERDRERAEARAEVLNRFTPREQRLIREAAVMGFVRGSFVPAGRGECPRDSAIVAMVLDGCLSCSDTFPLIATGEMPALPSDMRTETEDAA